VQNILPFVFYDVKLCVSHRLRERYEVDRVASSSEMSVSICHTTWYHIQMIIFLRDSFEGNAEEIFAPTA
jgi:hypothetical protein